MSIAKTTLHSSVLLEIQQPPRCRLAPKEQLNAPRHRAEHTHAEADYDEETARDNYFNPPGRPPFQARGSN